MVTTQGVHGTTSFPQLLLVWTGLVLMPRACEHEAPVAPVEIECVVDDDCVLMPSAINCCGECPPAPPYDAVSGEELASLLIQLETDCAEWTRLCEPPACEIISQRCEPRAICVEGRCRTDAAGCPPEA